MVSQRLRISPRRSSDPLAIAYCPISRLFIWNPYNLRPRVSKQNEQSLDVSSPPISSHDLTTQRLKHPPNSVSVFGIGQRAWSLVDHLKLAFSTPTISVHAILERRVHQVTPTSRSHLITLVFFDSQSRVPLATLDLFMRGDNRQTRVEIKYCAKTFWDKGTKQFERKLVGSQQGH